MFNPRIYENSRSEGIGVLEVVGDEQPRFVPLKRTEVCGEIVGPLAALRLRQLFRYTRTESAQVLEAAYRFPLPGDAAVSGVTVRFGDVEIVAELKARELAEADYAAAKQTGRQAVLATREAPDVFTLQVAGLQPEQDIVIETAFVQCARAAGQGWSLRLPLTTPPRYIRSDELNARHAQGQPLALLRDPGHRFALDVVLHQAETVASPTHDLALATQADLVRVQLKAGEVIPDRDCVLTWTPTQAAERPVLRALCHAEPSKNELYFLAQVAPPRVAATAQPVPREVILLVDHSGSMTGPKWAAADWAVERFLTTLLVTDAFALGVFHNTTQWFAPQLQMATDETVASAVQWLKQQTDSGGTELGVALEQALALARLPGERARHILLLTDAAVTDAGRILRLADAEAERIQTDQESRRRISLICIDAAPNAFLAQELAERGGGVARFLTSEPEQADITTALDEVLADWAAPVLTGLRLGVNRQQVAGGGQRVLTNQAEAWQLLDLGDLPLGRTLWVVGRTTYQAASRDATLAFRLQLANGTSIAATAVEVTSESAFPALKALFGARRVNALEYLIHAGYHTQQLAEQLTRLGYDPTVVFGGQAQQPVKVYAENARTDAATALRALLVAEALRYQLASAETSFVAVRKEAGALVTGTVWVANALPTGWSGEFVTPRALAAAPTFVGQRTPMMARAPAPANFLSALTAQRAPTGLTSRSRTPASPTIPPAPAQVVVFAGVPIFSGDTALLYATDAQPQPTVVLPGEGTLTGLQARCLKPGNAMLVDQDVLLLLFVGDLAEARAKIRLSDLLRQGQRPLNVLRRAGQVVRLVLQDPTGALRPHPLALEITLRWS